MNKFGFPPLEVVTAIKILFCLHCWCSRHCYQFM